MLVDLVLSSDRTYWRKRINLVAVPRTGETAVLVAAPEVIGVVVGSATPFADDGSVASVLLRAAPAPTPVAHRASPRREGWNPLL